MASVSLTLDARDLAALRNTLNPKQVQQALYQGTARTTRKGRVMAGDEVRKRLTIRKKFIDAPKSQEAAIRQFIRGKPAIEGRIETRDISLPLSEFQHVDSRTAGVTITIDKTRPQLTLRHAFKATVASKAQTAQGISHKGIWTRRKMMMAIQMWTTQNPLTRRIAAARGDAEALGGLSKAMQQVARGRYTPEGYAWRTPMKEEFGPSVFDLVSKNDVLATLVRNIHNLYRQEVGNQLSRFTQGRITSLDAAAFAEAQDNG